ncbi:efflux RND transporter permease subunit [Viridibacillus sp. YIM B01967]|uniref:Efflux RND transporter permease subunit n=1 Tax=Viridibacillus soli TaxID=2798301 RepID=A0ABS1HD45_9BACL|nr:efflux RND transporter permease subunit [Viridibacillus soli]MBK3497329.1 efflux RND transporter permease subunit [Viridibacillus soli]
MSLFTKWSFKNKAAIILVTTLVLLLGLVSYFKLPMEFLPPADQPQVTIVAMGQGVDSHSMEEQVTTPIETAVGSVKGKKDFFSTTGDGFSKVDIIFESKTNMKDAKQEVQEALATVTLPENVQKPSIIQFNTSMIPIADVSVTFKDGLTQSNSEFAKKKIIPMYKDIKGVADVQTFGTESSFVSIKLDNKLLTEKQLSLENIMTALQDQNLSASVGEKTIDEKASNIKIVGKLNSVQDIEQLSIAPDVKLTDVAKVSIKKPNTTLTRVNGKDALILIMTKESNANAVSTGKEIAEVTKKMNKQYSNVQSDVIMSTADLIEGSVNTMMKEVLLGALFATIVIVLFLRNLRSTFITIVSIPLSLAFTLFLLWMSGVSLNILTLGGVAVAVGRLVDDSIVVIENIFRKMQKEKFSVSLIVEATKEVGTAILASTLTTVAVFLPIGLVSGGLQDFLMPFALTITYSLLASLIVAVTVVPLMSSALLKNSKLAVHKPAVRFSRLLTWTLNHKWVVYLLSLLLFAGSIGTYFAMPKGEVDKSTADFIQATLEYPNDTPLEKVKENTLRLEDFIHSQDEVEYEYTQLGNTEDAARFGDVNSPTLANIMIMLKDSKDTEQMLERLEKQKKEYVGAVLTVNTASFMSGSSTAITIDVMGDDLTQIEETATIVKEKIEKIKGIEKVTTNQDAKKMVYSFKVNAAEGSAKQISQQLGVFLNRTPIGMATIGSQPTTIMLEPLLNPKTTDELNKMLVATPKGMEPLSKVATLKQEEKPTNVFHKDGNSYVSITASVDPEQLSKVNEEITKTIFGKKDVKGMKIPDGVNVYIGGASAQQADDFSDLFITMLVSIGIVFLIMVVTFKTFRAPIAILCSLPLAAIGAILGLLISGITVDITALLGALMLIGIVVTNAIVLLDRVKQNEQTMIIRDALVEAAATRMRPILMTAMATVCAMIPLLFKKAESTSLVSSSLAVVVIGGLTMATLLTLVVIPVIYESLHFRKAKNQRREQAREMNESI